MKKTIKQWFESVADPKLRKELLANTEKTNLNTVTFDLSYAIIGAFIWGDTTEGDDYWKLIYINAVNKKIETIPFTDNPKVKTYHNTTRLKGEELKTAEQKAQNQDQIIKEYFDTHSRPVSSCDLFKKGILEKAPITSIRRSVSNLWKQGYIEAVGRKEGMYGRTVFTYKKA